MELEEKIQLLCAGARYDIARPNSFPAEKECTEVNKRITYIKTPAGKEIPVLKLLFSNFCIYDCLYCPIRKSNNVIRTSFTVQEVVNITVAMYSRREIRGLFLSSGIVRNPDFTSSLLIQVVKKLRQTHGFSGYIHLKIIPGTAEELIKEAGKFADRLSVNIELPTSESLQHLAPDKSPEAIFKPMRFLGNQIMQNREEVKKLSGIKLFSPAGHTTQLIVGASPETDRHILTLARKLYQQFHLSRIYYSAYVPVNPISGLSEILSPPVQREHRLYQADWLIRFYGFQPEEILPADSELLDENLDPKSVWAIHNPDFFPLEINRADREALLRVPGIGLGSVERILRFRRFYLLKKEDLVKLGISWEKARHFITVQGQFFGSKGNSPETLTGLFRSRVKIIRSHLPLLPGFKKLF